MAPRGRKRKADPSLPKHIAPDFEKIPTGLYWDGRWGGVWYAFNPPGMRPRRSNVATHTATLADLHAIAEARSGKTSSRLLRGLTEAFANSPQCRRLSKDTRDDYAYCAKVVTEFKLPRGGLVGDLVIKRITQPVVQGLVDAIALGNARDAAGELIPTPSKAAHVQRYLRRLFRWGMNRGYNDINPADGIELPVERKRRVLPDSDAMNALIAFARQNAGGRGTKDSVAPYLWACIVIGYRVRLRPIEVRTLTDANETEIGIVTNRRKGSRDNITTWSPELREAWDYLVAERKRIFEKRKRPTPIRAEDRPLVVNMTGDAMLKSTFSSAWRRLMALATEKGVLTEAQRFGAHSLKRRGITDTPGTRPEKQLASGHVNEHMLEVYDFDLPVVAPAQPRSRPQG